MPRQSANAMKFLASIALPLLLFLFGCSGRSDQSPQSESHIIDDLGRQVALLPSPHRIISLAPSMTETLFALRTDSVLVGVTDYCDYPPEARSKTSVGGIVQPSLERIVDLKPDLILMTVSGNIKSDFEKLEQLGFRIFVTSPDNVDGILKSISDIGALTKTSDRARRLVDSLRKQEEQLIERARASNPPAVLLILSLHPLIAVGSGTFVDELLKLSNARNIAADAASSYPLLSREFVLQRRPDVILATSDVARTSSDIVNAYPEWKLLPAVKNGRVKIVEADVLTRPGPRIMQGLDTLVRVLHATSE